MNKVLDWLARTPVILLSLVLMMLIGAGFGLFADAFGGTLLDEKMTGGDAQALLENLSDEQKLAHFWVTVLLDSAYPLAYGAFFVGLLARLAGSWRRWVVWPPLVSIDCDFAENVVQAIALAGNPDWLWLKDVLTPLKFGGLLVGAVLIGLLALLALWRQLTSRSR